MSGFIGIGGEGLGVPVTGIEWQASGYLFRMADRDSEERRLRRLVAPPDVDVTYEFTLNEAGMAWARMMAEEAVRREWIEDVKRRLGLLEPGDPVIPRMEQWEQDHAEPDPRIALCVKGRELDTALTLELYDERVSEVRGHPWMQGNEMWLFRPEPIKVEWPELKWVRCPACTALMVAGIFDPSCHYSFCTIAHPPPVNLGGLMSGF